MKLGVGAVMLTLVLGALGCGDDSSSSDSKSSASASSGKYGGGLKLTDKVIKSPEVASIKGPWVRWNKDTCAFEETTDHPATYKAQLRKIDGDYQIGYMHYGNSDSFGIANSKNIEDLAKQAGFKLSVYNLKFPSETEPLSQARTATVKGDKGVITATQNLWEQQYKILAGKCIPPVQLYAFGTKVPNFGVSWSNAGTEVGKALGTIAKEKGWAPEDTALVQCGNPEFGESVNAMFKTAPDGVTAAGFAIDPKNVFTLTCKVGKHETVTSDWLTAHPDFKHVLFDTIDDPSGAGMINAIRKAGKQADSLLVVTGADPQGRKAIRAGTETGSLAFFPERYGEWSLAMLEDILAGNPVPMEVNHPTPLITKDTIDQYYPNGD